MQNSFISLKNRAFKLGDIEEIKKIQKSATKRIIKLKQTM